MLVEAAAVQIFVALVADDGFLEHYEDGRHQHQGERRMEAAIRCAEKLVSKLRDREPK